MLLGYDTANSAFVVPGDAQFVVCYGDRLYENEEAARARFPHLFAAKRAVVLTAAGAIWKNPLSGDDIEKGNADPSTAGEYVAGEHAKGVARPWVYSARDDMLTNVDDIRAAGIPITVSRVGRPFRMYVAHPNGIQHVCSPEACGFPYEVDMTQFWWDSLQGPWHGFPGDLDVNLAHDDAFIAVPPVPPKPRQEDFMLSAVLNHDGRLEVFRENPQTGEVHHTWQLTPGGSMRRDEKTGKVIWASMGIPGK